MNGSSSSCVPSEIEPYRSSREGSRADKNPMKRNARVEGTEKGSLEITTEEESPKVDDLLNSHALPEEPWPDLR